MTLQITANPKRQSAFGITANTRRTASVGSRINWDSLFDLPAAIEFFAENDVGANEYPHGDASGNWQYSTVSPFSRTVLDDTTANAWLTTITATRAETGATAVPVLNKLREVISVKDFGALGDDSNDDTAEIQAALDAAAAMTPPGAVHLPRGTYRVSSALTVSTGVVLRGDGRNVSILKTTSATANIVNLSGTEAECHGIGFTSSVTRTGGRNLNATGQLALLSDIAIRSAFLGLYIGAHVRVDELYIANTVATTGTSIQIDAADQEVVIRSLLIDSSGTDSLYGIRVDRVGNLVMSKADVLHSGTGLAIIPSTGNATAVYISDSYFDTNASHGVLISPSGTGIVQECHFHGVWSATSTAGNGFVTTASGSGAVRNISFVDCMGINNAAGQGIAVLAGENVSVSGGLFAANLNGILVAANLNDFSITGVTAGNYGRFAGNSEYGINVATGTSDRYVISSNRLQGNTSGPLNDGGSGTNKYIQNNVPLTANGSLYVGSSGLIDFGAADVTLTHSANTLTMAGGTLVLPNAGLQIGSSVPFSDAAGTLTLQNVDALDATTEATIEAAVDTLANLTSIQGRTVTLADAGANAFFGWDDAAGAYENLTASEAMAIIQAVSGTWSAAQTFNAAVVFNENAADIDLRMEGDTEANLFFLDASTDRIGIGTATPSTRLHVNQSQNGDTNIRVQNSNAGAAATARLQQITDAGTADFVACSAALGAFFNWTWSGAGTTQFIAQNATGSFNFLTGASPSSKMALSNAGVLSLETDRSSRWNNQTSGAGASTGTLTNAPAAGNPGHWLKVNVNGTNYCIPCWAG